MTIAEFKLDRVATYGLPAGDAYTGIRSLTAASMDLPCKITLSNILGTRGVGTKVLHLVIVFASIGPVDSDFIPDQLDVLRH